MCRRPFKRNTDLFVDIIRESGAMEWYFSLSPVDVQFGSLCPWTPEQETRVTCAAGNLPYESMLRHILGTMDSSVSRGASYRRVLLLPLRIGVYYEESVHAGV